MRSNLILHCHGGIFTRLSGSFYRRLVDGRFSAISCSMISIDSSSPDPMKVQAHGEESDNTRQKLANYTGQVPWSYLAPHSLTDNLYFVDPALKLEDVGAAISGNRTDLVNAWLKSGDLVKIEALHAAQWENSKNEFEALVVSPFVLCRPV